MPSLSPELRKQLENAIPKVRDAAEAAAEVVLDALAVNRAEPPAALGADQRSLRNRLRARGRALGSGVLADGLNALKEEIAYEQWHRMVFARFLAENGLLMHPSGVAVTLQDCAELAAEEGQADAWETAARYAGGMLPGIFRSDDPAVMVRFAPEGRIQLESILTNLPAAIFTAEDALGWMYQFWQKNKKDEVNASERKIGGADLSPVTQLFTEDYMVRFLLENSLGAWWAARHPESALVREWKFLRWTEPDEQSEISNQKSKIPAAGSFSGWPERAAQVTLIDPCCGSGHILVAGFEMLVRMRMEEEGLSAADAGEAVLRENLFGLELDPRCTQIAAFALALTAWRSGGYRPLPVPNVACTGIAVQGQLETWLKLAGDDSRVRAGLERLYHLFKNAPDLGSLINPADLPAADRMFVADYEQVAPVLEQALAKERNAADPVAEVFGAAAEGAARAVRLLAKKYILVVTNVPYLIQGKQSEIVREFSKTHYPESDKDLATTFVERCMSFSSFNGTISVVTPHNWRFLKTYATLRKKLLTSTSWNLIVNLGPKAFNTPLYDFNIGMSIITNKKPEKTHIIGGIDVSTGKSPDEKALLLPQSSISFANQLSLLKNSQFAITLATHHEGLLLSDFATVHYGSKPGQTARVTRFFWEITPIDLNFWMFMESTPSQHGGFTGKSELCYSLNIISKQNITEFGIRGKDAWDKKGIILSKMANLPCSLYLGNFFDDNTYVILPQSTKDLAAIYSFVKSPDFRKAVRERNQKLAVDTGAMIDVPFDMAYWQTVADKETSLTEPYSNDPTQWLFDGQPRNSVEPLQVAIARLLGYLWPRQIVDTFDDLADSDGIVCLPSVTGERPLAERVREMLAAAFGNEWSPRLQAELLAQAGAAGKSLEDWLRDDFFARHCRIFQNRPFIWHIWDGRKDGFSALVNYHKLDAARLDKLIYTYLGDWIRFQRARRDHGEPGADGRLVAALELEKKLKLIKEGEPPYDIYIRWKALRDQPLGWNPDLNDGVRLNIRPFVLAGVLRAKFTINWNKDRGKNPDGSDRENDKHYTVAEKRSAVRGG